MSDLDPTNFPMTRSAARNPERFDAAVRLLADGIEQGAIRNVDLKDAKHILGSAVDKAWDSVVSDPFFWSGKWESHSEEVQKLYSDIMVMSLHDLLATSRKLGKTKATGPAIDAMRALTSEALPLAEAAAALKAKVVKGRTPSAAPAKPENPNKTVRTCPCCFRSIAVVSGRMALHGYKRPGYGYQTSSCAGVRFRPLEVSDEGLVWLISVYEARIAKDKATLARGQSGELTSLTLTARNGKITVITPADEDWNRALRGHIQNLESAIRIGEYELAALKKRHARWKPTETGNS